MSSHRTLTLRTRLSTLDRDLLAFKWRLASIGQAFLRQPSGASAAGQPTGKDLPTRHTVSSSRKGSDARFEPQPDDGFIDPLRSHSGMGSHRSEHQVNADADIVVFDLATVTDQATDTESCRVSTGITRTSWSTVSRSSHTAGFGSGYAR
jgi:hypothetical protein